MVNMQWFEPSVSVLVVVHQMLFLRGATVEFGTVI